MFLCLLMDFSCKFHGHVLLFIWLRKLVEDTMEIDLKEVKGAIDDIKQRASKIEVYL